MGWPDGYVVSPFAKGIYYIKITDMDGKQKFEKLIIN